MTNVIEDIDKRVIDTIREAVAENPEFVYPVAEYDSEDSSGGFSKLDPAWHSEMGGCRYQYKGEPRCLIGHVVHRIDPSFDLEAEEGQSAYDVLQKLGVSDKVANAAKGAQIEQDSGNSWKYALEKFEEVLKDE